MKIEEVIRYIESVAPPAYQESYDNAGLIAGDAGAELKGVLVCLDCTEEIIEEAVRRNCNLVISHHPVLFTGLKRLTGATYVERVLVRSIREDIALYAAHTNLDNAYRGVNAKIAEKLGLARCRILRPGKNLLTKLAVFCPREHADAVRNVLFSAGAGNIGNYSECSFSADGTGTFTGNDEASPFVGEKGRRHAEPETRVEVILESARTAEVLAALRKVHPYEEPAVDLFPLQNSHDRIGAGLIGELAESMPEDVLLNHIKKIFRAGCVRHTRLLGRPIRKVAVCGGAGSFLLQEAIRQGAGLFLSADFKYHQFFDADGRIVVADIGHYESEQFTVELLAETLKDKIPTFALHLAETITNPVYYI